MGVCHPNPQTLCGSPRLPANLPAPDPRHSTTPSLDAISTAQERRKAFPGRESGDYQLPGPPCRVQDYLLECLS